MKSPLEKIIITSDCSSIDVQLYLLTLDIQEGEKCKCFSLFKIFVEEEEIEDMFGALEIAMDFHFILQNIHQSKG